MSMPKQQNNTLISSIFPAHTKGRKPTIKKSLPKFFREIAREKALSKLVYTVNWTKLQNTVFR